MPRYGAQNPQHPLNKAVRYHAALEKTVKPGAQIPISLWRRWTTMGMDAVRRQQVDDVTDLLERIDLITWERGEYVELNPREARDALLELPV